LDFFKDKPEARSFTDFSYGGSAEQFLVDNGILTIRSIDRRLKVLPVSDIVSVTDFRFTRDISIVFRKPD